LDLIIVVICCGERMSDALKPVFMEILDLFDGIIKNKNSNSNSRLLKNKIDVLEDSVSWGCDQEVFEDALWDYTDILRLFLMEWHDDTPNALIELRDLFKNNVIPLCLATSAKKHEANLFELKSKLDELKLKYEGVLPSYYDLKKRVDNIKFDDDLRKELGNLLSS
jgi:hypothetical protein